MAEIFLLTRGHHDHVDKFIRSMRSQFFPMKFKKKLKDKSNGQEVEVETVINTEAQLRPYQLWGYVIPEEYVGPVCNNLGIPTDETWLDQKEGSGGTSFRSGFGVKGFLEAARVLLKAKKLKKDLKKGYWSNPIYRDHVNVLGIGWKPDGDIETPMGNHEGI